MVKYFALQSASAAEPGFLSLIRAHPIEIGPRERIARGELHFLDAVGGEEGDFAPLQLTGHDVLRCGWFVNPAA